MNTPARVAGIVLLAVAACLAGLPAYAGIYDATVLGDRATQYYRLDETSGAIAVNAANPGTNNGTYLGGYTQGLPGALADPATSAVLFNGSTGYVGVGSLGARPAQGTIEFWMYADAVENYRNPLSTSGAAGGNEGFRFEENAAGNFHVRVGNDGGVTHTPYTLTNSLAAGQWYHVAVTWDSTANNLQGYLNGRRVFSVTPTAMATNFAAVEIGRGFSTAAERSWKGRVDEAAFYGTALNSADIQWHYQTAAASDGNIVANSIAEFSGAQGQNNWQYGYGSGGTFAPLSTYSASPSGLVGNPGAHWNAGSGAYPKLWDTGAHPDNSDSRPATRRWISEVTGLVKISGRLAKYDVAGGDGVVGDVLVNGVNAFSQAILYNDATGVNYTTYAMVQAGQPIDFAVQRRGSHGNDSTKFTATIEAMPLGVQVFDLAADFNTAQNSAANTWHYVLIDGNNRDGSYSLLATSPTTNHGGNAGVNGWGANYPGIWKNTTGTAKPAFVTDLLSAGAVAGHPGSTDGIATAWVAPERGLVDIDGFVKLIDPGNSGASDVNWYLDLGSSAGNLDSGYLDFDAGPSMQSFSISGLEVQPGDVIYLSVLNRGSLSNDNTQMSMAIAFTAIPEPTTVALLGMGLALLGPCLLRRRRRRALAPSAASVPSKTV
jgi:hypothetical protein